MQSQYPILYLPWHVESLLSQVWFPRHVLVEDPDRSKLWSQDNVAITPTPYSPLAREAWSYKIPPSAGAVNGGQVAMHEQV